jgi:hypothetical protein
MKIENLLTAGVCWQKYIFTFILYVQILVHSTKITIRTRKKSTYVHLVQENKNDAQQRIKREKAH